MPSTSKSQQRLFSMALAVRKGKLDRSKVYKQVLDIVDSDMTDKQIEDFTKLKESYNNYAKMLSLRDYITEADEQHTLLQQLINPLAIYDGWTYEIGGVQVEVSNPTKEPAVGQSIIVCGKGKDLPCIIKSVDPDKHLIVLRLIGGFSYLDAAQEFRESFDYDTQYASGTVPAFTSVLKPEVFVVIKPGFFKYAPEIIEMFEKEGFKLEKTRAKLLTLKEAQKLYYTHKNEDFYERLCKYMTSDTTYGMIFTYNKGTQHKALELCEKIKERVRELWSLSDMKNVMHSSDTEEHMREECGIYF